MATEPDLSEFEKITDADELRKALRISQTRLRIAKAKTADLVQAAREGAREAMVILGNPPAVPAPKHDKRDGKPEVALLHLSDWQLGKRTESYSSAVACERIERLSTKVEQIAAIERADHPVRELHVLLGGDLVEGNTIFPGQQYEIDAGLFEQIMTAIFALEKLLRAQLSVFDRVVCWEVEGNHGRHGKRGENPREDNADLFIYGMTRELLTRTPGVEKRLVWHPRDHWYRIVEIGAYRALLVHGDQVKQFGGNTPAFGIERKVNGWVSGVIRAGVDGAPVIPFTDCYMGHFHKPLVLPLANGRGRTFLNPSLESDSAFAQEFLASDGTPGQRLHFVDPAKGRVTTERLLWLD